MDFVYNDGGRRKYFTTGNVGDCVTRAICNATGRDYLEVYKALKRAAENEHESKYRRKSSVRDGVRRETWRAYLENVLGWVYHQTCAFGSNAKKVKLRSEDLPGGILIVQISKHLTCVKDGVLYDTYNCSVKKYHDWHTGEMIINDKRCVYGYWTPPIKKSEPKNKIEKPLTDFANNKEEK